MIAREDARSGAVPQFPAACRRDGQGGTGQRTQGGAAERYDGDYLRKALPKDGSVTMRNITTSRGCFVVASQARFVDRCWDMRAFDFKDLARLALSEQPCAVRFLKANFRLVSGCHYSPKIVRPPRRRQCAPMRPRRGATLRAILNQSSTNRAH